MTELIFADGIGSITVVGGTVRLDLVVLEPQSDGGRPKPVLSQRLILPIEGFTAAARHIQEAGEAIKKIEPRMGGAPLATEPVEKSSELIAARTIEIPEAEARKISSPPRPFP